MPYCTLFFDLNKVLNVQKKENLYRTSVYLVNHILLPKLIYISQLATLSEQEWNDISTCYFLSQTKMWPPQMLPNCLSSLHKYSRLAQHLVKGLCSTIKSLCIYY